MAKKSKIETENNTETKETKKASLQFSVIQIIEEAKESGEQYITPTKDTFINLEDVFIYTKDNYIYEVKVEKHDDYIFFIFAFGNTEPIDKDFTSKTGTKKPNNRTTDEAELNNQAFFLFHYKKKFLYVSNYIKKGVLESILKEKMQTGFTIQSIFKNESEFIDVLNECKSISFTNINDLFGNVSDQRKALVDLTGTDAPKRFTIIADYSKHKIVNFIKDICKGKRESKIDKLIIRGIDESGFGIVYNVDSFREKIKISCKKDSNGKFIVDEVRDNLLEWLKNER